MKKKIYFFDKDDKYRMDDYLLRIDDYLENMHGQKSVELITIGYLDLLNKSGEIKYTRMSNDFGPSLLTYRIDLDKETTRSKYEIRGFQNMSFPMSTITDDTHGVNIEEYLSASKRITDKISFVNDELTSLFNRIDDYYENVAVNFEISSHFGTLRTLVFFTIKYTKKELESLYIGNFYLSDKLALAC